MQEIEVKRHISAPIEAVWARYTDHVSWQRWAGLATVRVHLEREGTPSPNGTGAVRVFTTAGAKIVAEEVTSFTPVSRMTYRILRGGGPIRDHAGEVLFKSEGAGTLVTWRCRFDATVPGMGPVLKMGIGFVFRHVLRHLARDLTRS